MKRRPSDSPISVEPGAGTPSIALVAAAVLLGIIAFGITLGRLAVHENHSPEPLVRLQPETR